ncbi:MAG: copper resistance protein B [Gammaproteobacteria bacterium]|nr:copper resistance protein B [Gammaproteobacteria bacterium]
MSITRNSARLLTAASLFSTALLISAPVLAQAAVDHSQHTAPAQAPAPATAPTVDHSQHMAPAAADVVGQSRADPLPQGGRDPHAYSGRYQRGSGLYALAQGHDQLHLADSHRFGAIVIDQLERADGDDEATLYDLQAWISQGYQRVTLKAEGDIEERALEESRTELLWSRALSPYWDTQLGVRHDTGAKPDQSWLALGVQGLAPYWFEIDATAYLGSGGQTSLRLDTEYELLLTQQLILQPAAELNLYGKSDTARGVGSGLSDVTLGLRLRYEFTRQFAPYVGVEWTGKYGDSKKFTRVAGEKSSDTRWVAGVRFWLSN